MGWDCTLHAVDERSLARFAARFLHGLHREAAFDREYEADAMIAEVKQLIADDPATGGGALGELALLYASTEAPHVYCRDLALSLWDEARLGPLPARWLGTVESRLPDIVAAYPKLAARVPCRFDDHHGVGPFVSARDVPALLAHLEGVIDALPAGDRAPYERLRAVLRVAAARGLAYWEGTDIDVAQANAGWLADELPQPVTAPSPLASPLARPLAVAGTRMLVGEHFVLHELDTATFPPGVVTYEDMQVTTAAFTPWGTDFVRMATDRNQRPFKFAYYELPSRTPLAIEPPYAIGRARAVRDGVLVFPQPMTTELAGVRPLLLRTGTVLEPLEVPEATISPQLQCDAVAFGDGSLLVIWDGTPYRWDGESAPVALGEPLEATEDLGAAVALADGSIVGGFGRRLVRIDRDGRRDIVLPLDNVLAVAKGPGDVLIISEGENPDGDVWKLWWPETRELTHVRAGALGLDDRPMFTYVDPAAQLVIAARPGAWHAIPWSELAAMRREPVP